MAKKVINKSIETKKAVGTDIKKLKMLITVVDRSKSLFYMDLLEQFEVNMQTVIYGFNRFIYNFFCHKLLLHKLDDLIIIFD